MKIPLVVAFNKCDVADAKIPLEWIENYEKFMEALSKRGNYLSTLNK
jgi:signal recognition particle receptor subunit beta